jgi:hypothetical protein
MPDILLAGTTGDKRRRLENGVSVALADLHELDQDAAHGRRVHEGDAGVARARPGSLVDQPSSLGAQMRQRLGDVLDAVRDVMEARSCPD